MLGKLDSTRPISFYPIKTWCDTRWGYDSLTGAPKRRKNDKKTKTKTERGPQLRLPRTRLPLQPAPAAHRRDGLLHRRRRRPLQRRRAAAAPLSRPHRRRQMVVFFCFFFLLSATWESRADFVFFSTAVHGRVPPFFLKSNQLDEIEKLDRYLWST